MNSVAAYAPGHITGIFHIDDAAENPLERGSLGAGFSIEPGVITRISEAAAASAHDTLTPRFLLQGKPVSNLNVSRQLYAHFTQSLDKTPHRRLEIDHTIDPPQSSGFGTSGAGALSLSLALNNYFGRPYSREEAAQIAHLVEIECRTGLGTVIGEYVGGFEIRTKAGAPGIGAVETFPYPDNIRALFAVRGASLTSTALSDPAVREGVNRSGKRNLVLLRETPNISNFLYYSRCFSTESGLITPWVESVLELLDKRGIVGSMLMFGEAVFTLMEEEGIRDTEAALREYCARYKNAEPDILIFSASINASGGKYL